MALCELYCKIRATYEITVKSLAISPIQIISSV